MNLLGGAAQAEKIDALAELRTLLCRKLEVDTAATIMQLDPFAGRALVFLCPDLAMLIGLATATPPSLDTLTITLERPAE